MKLLTAALCALTLTACSTFRDVEVVKEYHYVVRQATDQQKNLPPMPEPLDVTTADQSALATWILRSEQRMMDLESIIKRLVEFYERPVNDEERRKLDEEKKAAEAKKAEAKK